MGDQLTKVGSTAITYDAIGNPYLTDADKWREEWMRAVMDKRLPYKEIIDNAVKGRIGG